MRNLIRSTITAWVRWRARRAMRRAYPELRDLDIQLAKCRARHRRGAARIVKARQEVVTRALSRQAGAN